MRKLMIKEEKTRRRFVQFDWSHEVKVTGEKCLLMHTVWTTDHVSTCTNADASRACWSAKDASLSVLPWWPETWMAMTAQQESWHQMKTGEWASFKPPYSHNYKMFYMFLYGETMKGDVIKINAKKTYPSWFAISVGCFVFKCQAHFLSGFFLNKHDMLFHQQYWLEFADTGVIDGMFWGPINFYSI